LKKKYIPWIVVFGVVFADQLSKILVKTNMNLGQNIHVIGDWFILHFTENPGMAFGMEFSIPYGKLLLSLIRIVAIFFIGWYILKVVRKGAPTGFLICLGMIFAGALGNIIDSAFYGVIFSESHFSQPAVAFPEGGGYASFLHGKVVDMFYFPIIKGTYPQWFPFWGGEELVFFRPVFNIADASISMAIFTIVIFQKRFFAFERKTATEPEEGVVSTSSTTEETQEREEKKEYGTIERLND
jgi:signal peptidase II